MSPRSERLIKHLPSPKGAIGTTIARLNHAQLQVAGGLDYTRKVQAAVGGLLKRHFETIPQVQVKAPLHLLIRKIRQLCIATLSIVDPTKVHWWSIEHKPSLARPSAALEGHPRPVSRHGRQRGWHSLCHRAQGRVQQHGNERDHPLLLSPQPFRNT